VEGAPLAESFLERMTNNTRLIKLVCALVEAHLRPNHLAATGAGRGGFARLHRKMQAAGGDLRLLGRVSQCDGRGIGFDRSLVNGVPSWEHDVSDRVMEFADLFDNEPEVVKPLVMGRDLIELGMKPGVEFGDILKEALELQDSDSELTKEEILSQVLGG